MSHLQSISLLEEKILYLDLTIKALMSVDGDKSARILKLINEKANYQYTLDHLNEVEDVKQIVW